jgi:hypothetical protein
MNTPDPNLAPNPAALPPKTGRRRSLAAAMQDIGHVFALAVVALLICLLVYICVVMIIPEEIIRKNGWPLAKLPMIEAVRLSCAVVFVLTLALWIFDTVKWLPFTNKWASRAIWGIAISSILSSGALYFKDTGVDATNRRWRRAPIYPTRIPRLTTSLCSKRIPYG